MNIKNVIIGALLIEAVAANILLIAKVTDKPEVRVETHTEYVVVRDTMPKVVESKLTGDVITVKVGRPDANATAITVKKEQQERDWCFGPDEPAERAKEDTAPTVCVMGDSATVTLPVEQRVYEDSLYTAYVSGYRPRLDSILLRMPHTYTVTKTTGKAAKRWAVGPTVGAGYGVTGKQMDVFVGVSVTWNVLP